MGLRCVPGDANAPMAGDQLVSNFLAVENLTHSLLGAALAELTLPAGATTPQRRIFFGIGIVAANLPDADLIYTRIMPAPLGYLLHHRGHTHTVAGLVAQALLVGAVCALPAISRTVGTLRPRLWTLIAVSLLGHLVLDSWNSYGVHPFWPLDARWYYGDAIYILEPWLWLLLGVAATLNMRNDRGRMALGVTLATLAGALAWFGMIPVGALAALVAVAIGLAAITRSWTPRTRSGAALALTVLFVATMFGLRQGVRERVLTSIQAASRGEILDIVLSPRAANPLCWSALAIVKDEPTGEYVLVRGTATTILSSGCGPGRRAQVEWADPVHQSLATLRELNRRDCSVRAWMQFGRAPEIGERRIGDLRYGGATRENFSTMQLKLGDDASACPPNMTNWGMPRGDLLGRAGD
jgi:inner membrane protein